MELEDANISMHHKNDNEMSNSNELAMKHVEAKEKFVKTIVSRRSSKGKFKMSRGREREQSKQPECLSLKILLS